MFTKLTESELDTLIRVLERGLSTRPHERWRVELLARAHLAKAERREGLRRIARRLCEAERLAVAPPPPAKPRWPLNTLLLAMMLLGIWAANLRAGSAPPASSGWQLSARALAVPVPPAADEGPGEGCGGEDEDCLRGLAGGEWY